MAHPPTRDLNRHRTETEKTFSVLRKIVRNEILSPAYRSLFETALTLLKEKHDGSGWMPSVDLPWRVCRILNPGMHGVEFLSAACTSVHLAADVIDDLADGDLPAFWKEANPNLLTLMTLDWMSYIRDRCLSHLFQQSPQPIDSSAIRTVFSDGIHRMMEGQYLDLSLTPESPVSLQTAEAAISGKSGAQLELFARSAALAAGAGADQVEAIGEFGRYLGMVVQLLSDCHDLLGKTESSDLRNGCMTMPIVYALQYGRETDRLTETMAVYRAFPDGSILTQIRERLIQSGALAYAAMKATFYKHKALHRLEEIFGTKTAGALLEIFNTMPIFVNPAASPRRRALSPKKTIINQSLLNHQPSRKEIRHVRRPLSRIG